MTLVQTMLLSPQIDHKKYFKQNLNNMKFKKGCLQKKAQHSSHGELTRIAGGLCLSLTPKQVIICPWARHSAPNIIFITIVSASLLIHTDSRQKRIFWNIFYEPRAHFVSFTTFMTIFIILGPAHSGANTYYLLTSKHRSRLQHSILCSNKILSSHWSLYSSPDVSRHFCTCRSVLFDLFCIIYGKDIKMYANSFGSTDSVWQNIRDTFSISKVTGKTLDCRWKWSLIISSLGSLAL